MLYRNRARCRPEPVAPRGAVPGAPRHCALRLALRRPMLAESPVRSHARSPVHHCAQRTPTWLLCSWSRGLALYAAWCGRNWATCHWPCWAGHRVGKKSYTRIRLLNSQLQDIRFGFIFFFLLHIHVYIHYTYNWIFKNTLEHKWACPCE